MDVLRQPSNDTLATGAAAEVVVPATSMVVRLFLLCAIVLAATMAFVGGWLGTLYLFKTDLFQRYSPLVLQAKHLGIVGNFNNNATFGSRMNDKSSAVAVTRDGTLATIINSTVYEPDW
ncbi:uncharacterized protein LOC135393546 [Ornithodoros turicata]|uniref:uncharacterized protein LOC135393546 n=1 Tax=Ornithodoros turicata TaxID=34597 RepID=UPI003139507B